MSHQECLGPLLLAQFGPGVVLTMVHISLFSSIVGSIVFFNSVGTFKTDVLVFFCVGHLINGLMCAYRLSALANAGHALLTEVHAVRKALSELTVLKYKVLDGAKLLELSVLKEMFEDYVRQGGINASGVFALNRRVLASLLTVTFIVNLVVISYKL